MIVLDASAFVDAVDGNRAVIERLSGEEVHAPHLLDVEVTSALRRLVGAGRLDGSHAVAALAALETADIHRHPHTPLLGLIWSMRDTIAPYNGAYVALATALQAPLITTDRKLAANPNLQCTVELP